jgi:hypothetical protein
MKKAAVRTHGGTASATGRSFTRSSRNCRRLRGKEQTDLGASDGATGSEGSSDKRLSCSGRAVEEDASRRSDVEAEEKFWVEEREGHHLFELLDVCEERGDQKQAVSPSKPGTTRKRLTRRKGRAYVDRVLQRNRR